MIKAFVFGLMLVGIVWFLSVDDQRDLPLGLTLVSGCMLAVVA